MRAVVVGKRDRDAVIIIYQSSNREGSTFSLSPETTRALQARFGDELHIAPRVFIAHEMPAIERLRGRLSKSLVALLTGLDDELLDQIGGIEFWDPVSDTPL